MKISLCIREKILIEYILIINKKINLINQIKYQKMLYKRKADLKIIVVVNYNTGKISYVI